MNKTSIYLFTIILFAFFLVYFVFYFLDKKEIFIKKNVSFSYILIFFLLSAVFINNLKSIENLSTFPKNINNLIKESDEKFINHEYSDLIEELNLLTKDNECFQAFSYDQAIFYLLNKKSCSKFYNIWVIGSKKNQKIYIDELKFNNPKYILTEGPLKFYSPYKRYPHIKKFLDKEYSLYKSIHSWKILKKNI